MRKPFLTRKQWIAALIVVLILLAAHGLDGSGSTSTPSHGDACSQAQTKSSDPYVSDHDADRAIADCIDSLGGNG